MSKKDRIRQLEDRIEALEEDWRQRESAAESSSVQLVRELLRPGPVSDPVDFDWLWEQRVTHYAGYSEADDIWSGYL